MKKRWYVLGAVIIIGAVAGSQGGTTTPNPAPVATQTSSPVASAPVALSKTGVSSNVTIEVTGFDSTDTVGNNPYSNSKAKGVFKVVGLTLTNNQKDAITVTSGSFKLYDSKDREFTDSTDAGMSLTLNDPKIESFMATTVNPGMSVSGEVVFDVPKDATGFYLKASGGMVGTPIKLAVQ